MGLFDFFSEAPENTQISDDRINKSYKRSNFWDNTSRGFLDPNNAFYTGAITNQFNRLNNTYGGFANTALQLNSATGGSAGSSNSLLRALRANATNRASDDAQSFGVGLYGQGLNNAQGFANVGQGYYNQGMSGELNNAQANSQWQNSWLSAGAGLAGAALGGGGLGQLGSAIGGFLGGASSGSPSSGNGYTGTVSQMNINPNQQIQNSYNTFGSGFMNSMSPQQSMFGRF